MRIATFITAACLLTACVPTEPNVAADAAAEAASDARQSTTEEPTEIELPPCSLRDRIVTDGGFVFDVPLPCDPRGVPRDLGDPLP